MNNMQSFEFDVKRFQQRLKTKSFGREFIYLNQVESTMDIAMKEAQKGHPHGTIILAEKQTKGKARKENRNWTSDPSGNLYFTMILRSPQISFFPKAHFAAPIAVVGASRQFGVEAFAKWPNDVWADGKKMSGMIQPIEYDQNEDSAYFGSFFGLLGIGINVNQDFSKIDDPLLSQYATSISQILKKQVDREEFLAILLQQLEEMTNWSQEKIFEEYNKVHLLSERVVTIKPKGLENPDSFEATVVGLTSEGQLIVMSEGKQMILTTEEVGEIRPKL